MAAVCGDGPVPRDASGDRIFTLRIEEVENEIPGGIFVGFVATPPSQIDFNDVGNLYDTAAMWRLVGNEINANVPINANAPIVSNEINATSQKRLPFARSSAWSTDQLNRGDELRLVARGGADGEMQLSAWLNGEVVVQPTQMYLCSFAMELWPYVAVCGRVGAVRLLV